MTTWQNPADQSLHDDMNGAALLLPSWPSGMTQLTDAQVATIAAAAQAAEAAKQAALPNPQGFVQAVKTGLGGIVAANALSVAYPLFFAAVNALEWADVQELILDAQSKAIVNPAQYAELKAAAAQFNIPITLP